MKNIQVCATNCAEYKTPYIKKAVTLTQKRKL